MIRLQVESTRTQDEDIKSHKGLILLKKMNTSNQVRVVKCLVDFAGNSASKEETLNKYHCRCCQCRQHHSHGKCGMTVARFKSKDKEEEEIANKIEKTKKMAHDREPILRHHM